MRPNPTLDPGLFTDDPAQSYTLPANWYYDHDIYGMEHEAIFYRSWWYQCHESDLEKPGDYFACRVADQEIFIIRDQGNTLRAFYNVCSHRAHALLEGQQSCYYNNRNYF